jgi:hypothetical protein
MEKYDSVAMKVVREARYRPGGVWHELQDVAPTDSIERLIEGH